MKLQIFPVTLLLLTASIAHGQQVLPQPPPMISTAGTAEIHVKPDLADLSFDIEIRNVDLAAARKQQAAITAKLLTALRAADIKDEDLQASLITISPTWNERRGVETATVKFYSVIQTVSCTVHDVDKVPSLVTAAITAGVTGVTPPVFRTADLRKYRDQARVQAIRAAKEKAVALAGELGSKVGKPYSINENQTPAYYGGAYMNNSNSVQAQLSVPAAGGGGEDATPAFAPGTITVSAGVQVTFYLE